VRSEGQDGSPDTGTDPRATKSIAEAARWTQPRISQPAGLDELPARAQAHQRRRRQPLQSMEKEDIDIDAPTAVVE